MTNRQYALVIDRVVRRVRHGETSDLPPEAVATASAIIAAGARPMARARCKQWSEHEWSERRISSGRDAVRGNFDRFALRCDRCGLGTMEIRWVDLPAVPLPQGAEGSAR